MAEVAILWDFDGTLVDTGALWRDSEYAFLEARGLTWNDDASRRLVGGNLVVVSRVFEEVTGVRFSQQELREEFVGNVERALASQVPWMPGAQALLGEQHRSGVRCGLVTSSFGSIVSSVLSALDFQPFQTVVAYEDVTHPKPHPEPYLLAMRRLGVRHDHTVALEDSASGIASALEAGCHVLAIGAHAAGTDHSGPRLRHVDSLDGLTLADVLTGFPDLAAARRAVTDEHSRPQTRQAQRRRDN